MNVFYGASTALVTSVLTLYHRILTFNTLRKKAFEKFVGKGENAVYQHFLLFPQFFLPYQREKSSILSPANAFNIDEAKILLFGKRVNPLPHNATF